MNGDGTALNYVPSFITHPTPRHIYDNPFAGTRLTGAGVPPAATGNVGDIYTDTTNQNIYTKTADGWQGPQ